MIEFIDINDNKHLLKKELILQVIEFSDPNYPNIKCSIYIHDKYINSKTSYDAIKQQLIEK